MRHSAKHNPRLPGGEEALKEQEEEQDESIWDRSVIPPGIPV